MIKKKLNQQFYYKYYIIIINTIIINILLYNTELIKLESIAYFVEVFFPYNTAKRNTTYYGIAYDDNSY